MTVLAILEKLEKSSEYTSWKKENEDSYLVHAFRMNDAANENQWQIGYFNPKTHLISVFVVDEHIHRNPDAEVFKEQEKLVRALKLDLVKINETEALEKGNTKLKEEYKVDVFKSFMILQNLEDVGQVWNITFITQSFKTVNVKIDANSGVVVSHKQVSLISENH